MPDYGSAPTNYLEAYSELELYLDLSIVFMSFTDSQIIAYCERT